MGVGVGLEVGLQVGLSGAGLPVTLVPGPALPGGLGPEVGAAQVHDAGGEAQQAAVAVGPGHQRRRRRQAALLVGAAQQVQRSVLQVGRLLHQLGVQHQVRGGCRGGGLEQRRPLEYLYIYIYIYSTYIYIYMYCIRLQLIMLSL